MGINTIFRQNMKMAMKILKIGIGPRGARGQKHLNDVNQIDTQLKKDIFQQTRISFEVRNLFWKKLSGIDLLDTHPKMMKILNTIWGMNGAS